MVTTVHTTPSSFRSLPHPLKLPTAHPRPAQDHTHTLLEGILQGPDHQVFCLDVLFLHELGVTRADAAATEVHGRLRGHYAFYHDLELPAQARVQGVGSQYGCSRTTVPIKQGPVMTNQELHRKGLASGPGWLLQLSPSSACRRASILACASSVCRQANTYLLWTHGQPLLVFLRSKLTASDTQFPTGCLILIELRFLCIDDPVAGE